MIETKAGSPGGFIYEERLGRSNLYRGKFTYVEVFGECKQNSRTNSTSEKIRRQWLKTRSYSFPTGYTSMNLLVTTSKFATSTLISDKVNVNNNALNGSLRNVD